METFLNFTSNIIKIKLLKYKNDGFKDCLLLILKEKFLLLNVIL